MNKLLKVFSILLVAILLTGCGVKSNEKIIPDISESPVIELCDKLSVPIEEYNNQKITFSDFAKEVENLSNSFCSENKDNQICTHIKQIKTQNEYDYSLEDCSNKSGSFKDLCESSNNLKKKMLEEKDKTEKAYVSELKHQCDLLTE